uniref:Putative secreted protein n=1 Tax=Ixodes ricinus TaxID=34613 RepID=A0A147BED5_IXORI
MAVEDGQRRAPTATALATVATPPACVQAAILVAVATAARTTCGTPEVTGVPLRPVRAMAVDALTATPRARAEAATLETLAADPAMTKVTGSPLQTGSMDGPSALTCWQLCAPSFFLFPLPSSLCISLPRSTLVLGIYSLVFVAVGFSPEGGTTHFEQAFFFIFVRSTSNSSRSVCTLSFVACDVPNNNKAGLSLVFCSVCLNTVWCWSSPVL